MKGIDKMRLLKEIKDLALIDEAQSFLSDVDFIDAVEMLLNRIMEIFVILSKPDDVYLYNLGSDISGEFMIKKPDYSEFGGYDSEYERDMEKGFLVEAHEED